ncbi:DUF6233 domain-containing protein [Streptomyces sp. SP2-10]
MSTPVAAGTRADEAAASTRTALRTLAEGVPPCPHCRPDQALGHPSGPR